MLNNNTCPREQEVLDALQSGRMEPLREHLTACTDCADLALVAGFLRNESEIVQEELSRGNAHLPSASFVWWKSKLRAKRETQEQAMVPLRIAEKAALGAGGLAAAATAWWFWPSATQATALLSPSMVLLAGTAAVCVMGFALYAVFAKE